MDGASSWQTWIWRVGGVAVSVVALAIVVGSVDVAAAWTVLRGASLPVLVVALSVVALQVVIRGWRWRIVLPPRRGAEPVPVGRAIAPLLVGYLGNAVFPARLGEPIRAVLIARREGLEPMAAFGATMLERLVDIVTLALIGFAAALTLAADWWIVAVGGVAGLGGLVALGLLVTLGATRLADLGARALSHVGLTDRTRRLQGWARSFAAGVDRGRDLPRLARVLLLSTIAWVLDASIFWLVGLALGIDLGIAGAVLVGAVAVLATAIPAAPGYVGTFELAATVTAVALGVPQPEALALAVVVHVITVVPLAIAGAVAVVSMGTGLGRLAAEAKHEPT
jgi:glycosyltransferase 2 family protein